MALAGLAGSYNGLAFGVTTAYLPQEVTGLLDLPDLRTHDQPRGMDDGLYAGTRWTNDRVITMSFLITAPDANTLQTNVNTFLAAFVKDDTERTLAVLDSTRQVQARVYKRDVVMDASYFAWHATAHVEMHASDPRLYDVNQSSASTTLPTVGAGLTFNASFNLGFGGASSAGSVSAVNSGTYETRPVITITGPVDNPTVENVTTGKHITFQSLTIDAGDTLVIDMLNRTALYFVAGTSVGASRRSYMTTDSTWWTLPPGTSTVAYHANTVQNGSSMSMVWRSAWV